MSQTETVAVAIAAAATVGFGAYGFATSAPSTVTYLLIVVAGAALIRWLRKAPLPPALAIALAVQAAAHLAGGLVNVGDDVLYNASIGAPITALHTHVLQYDHVVHAFGVFVATLTFATLLAPPTAREADQRATMILCVFGGLGVGALNEMIEFIATTAHTGAHVGGYTNTGWDLVSNTIGALVGGIVIHRTRRSVELPA